MALCGAWNPSLASSRGLEAIDVGSTLSRRLHLPTCCGALKALAALAGHEAMHANVRLTTAAERPQEVASDFTLIGPEAERRL
jgi:hypothetical protein